MKTRLTPGQSPTYPAFARVPTTAVTGREQGSRWHCACVCGEQKMTRAAMPSAPDSPDSAVLATTAKPLRGLRILVVDDEPGVRTFISAGLRRDGHDVQTVS